MAQRHPNGGRSPRSSSTGLEFAKRLEGEVEAIDFYGKVVGYPIHESVGTLDDAVVGSLGGGYSGGWIDKGWGRWTVVQALHDSNVNFIYEYFNRCLFDVGKARDVEPQSCDMDGFQLHERCVSSQNVIEDGAIEIHRSDFTATGEEGGIDLISAESDDDGGEMVGEGVEQEGFHRCGDLRCGTSM